MQVLQEERQEGDFVILERKASKYEVRDDPSSQNSDSDQRSPLQVDQQKHAICHRLSSALSSSSSTNANTTTIPSAMQVWTRYLKRVHRASQLTYNDPKFFFHDFTAQLLQVATPRLPRSVSSLPRDWKRIQVILDKLEKRYTYIRRLQKLGEELPTNQTSVPPPVKIVVLGGSVLVGRNCRKLFTDMGMQMTLPNRHCTYSNRLQVFLDQVFSPNNTMFEPSKTKTSQNKGREPLPPPLSSGAISLFRVTKIAMGGTNTAVGSQVMEYDLLPLEARKPDIIVNAYSTNDMHILTILEAQNSQKGNITLRQRVFDMTQDFVRQVLDPNGSMAQKDDETCDDGDSKQITSSGGVPPLLLHMDDYLGNEQRSILATTELAQGVGVLAQYYGFASISYANLVRDIVYGDSYESWFSPQGWWPKGRLQQQEMEREIHPNMGMHIVATWVVVFNLLNIVVTFCSIQDFLPQEMDVDAAHSFEISEWPEYKSSVMAQVIPQNDAYGEAPGKPKFPPSAYSLPPYLNETLSLEHVTQEWNRHSQLATERKRNLETLSSSARLESTSSSCAVPAIRCPFSWVSGLSLQQNDEKYVQHLFDNYTVPSKLTSSSSTWKLVSDGGKLGFAPSKIGDAVQLQFDNLPKAISTVTFFFLKSYGPKWENSQVTVSIAKREAIQDAINDWQPLLNTPHQLAGFHGKETSEMYTEPIALSRKVLAGEALRITYELTGGQTFKLMGLAVCS